MSEQSRDILFLLPPDFEDNNRREYCPECAEIWGVLNYFPEIREALDIRYEGVNHPRSGLVSLLGEGRWNCPTLVLSSDDRADLYSNIRSTNNRHYLDNARDIGKYFAQRFGVPVPRGS